LPIGVRKPHPLKALMSFIERAGEGDRIAALREWTVSLRENCVLHSGE